MIHYGLEVVLNTVLFLFIYKNAAAPNDVQC